jgi:O-antigen ligase
MNAAVSRQTRQGPASGGQTTDGNREANSGRKTTEFWKIAIIIVAMMPLFQTIVTWDDDGRFTLVAHYIRQYSLPTTMLELILLITCALAGWRPHRQFLALSRLTRWLLLTALIAISISSVVISNNPTISTLFALRYVAHISLFGALVHMLRGAEKELSTDYWQRTILCGGLAYVAALSVFAIFVPKPEDFRWFERMPSATNVRQIGNIVALFALVPATLVLFERSRRNTAFAWVGLTCLLTFITWTGSRGALLSFCLAVGFAGWRNRSAITPNRIVVFVSAALIAVALSLVIPVPDSNFGLIRIADSVGSGDVSSGRAQIWQNTVSAILEAPIFGHGAGMFRQNMTLVNGFPFNHPHNFILQLIYDWGAVGGGLMIAILSVFGKKIILSVDGQTNARFLASSAFIGLTSAAMIDGPLFYPLPIIVAAALMCPQVACWRFRSLANDG